jgi:8-oxo-dGTP pyrophosphatase MutT (NUDIX family)
MISIASSAEELYQIADELRAVASMGLQFAANGYEKQRYECVMKASAQLIAVIENRSPDEIYTRFCDNLFHLSPFIGVEVAVFHHGRLLLIQRRDDGLWALPGGLTEVGETLAQAAVRELWEEAGIRGHMAQLLGIFDSRLWQTRTKAQLFTTIFLAESDDTPAVLVESDNSLGPCSETLDVGFFGEADLPQLSQGHHLRVPFVFKMNRGEIATPYFDQPETIYAI